MFLGQTAKKYNEFITDEIKYNGVTAYCLRRDKVQWNYCILHYRYIRAMLAERAQEYFMFLKNIFTDF